ncbi:TIGR02186 family protein [Seohaeicola zhoushanensis]|uniref:Membrane protein n=1 Tax=Seohaeicola zhoushanensis TaxID=1569283 RepID=A0A8J3H1I4_9RHOB|nr:TIGR02186 family protein [Seohaeicola zhoushanensis]GHF64093.1 membrane protein [Seohaeicola zhoushanensis]
MRALLVAFLMLLPGLALGSEEVVLGLSKDKVSITTSFDGSDILIFGAVKRETPIPEGPPLQVLITVTGPMAPVLVRRKEKAYGIWINRDAVEVDSAPSFYAVATTGPMKEVLKDVEDLRQKISIDRVIRSVGAPMNIMDSASFTDAVIRIRQDQGLYQQLEGEVALDEQTLFRTAIELPSNLVEGDYETRIFLTREGRVVSSYRTVIVVNKVGMERWLYGMAQENALLYGLMSLAIAIAAGWGASEAFRLLRQS